MSRPNLNRSRKVACVATLTAAGLSFGLTACGAGSSETETTASAGTTAGQTSEIPGQPTGTPPPGGAAGPMQLTAKQEECVTSQGVDLPDRSAGDPGQGDPGAMPDPEEMQAAFEACDIEMPEPPDLPRKSG
ncbi:MAG: hypothetical protein KDB52_00175 [Solirubrobacterales bacterium]|nr:hypothetical protein [Solirubrobacterales bacterium]